MKQRDILILLIPAFILVVIWVGFSIYHNAVVSTIPSNVNEQINPITPYFDTNTIENLKRRQVVIPVYQPKGTSISPSPSLQPVQPSLGASPQVSTKSSSQASSGGIISP